MTAVHLSNKLLGDLPEVFGLSIANKVSYFCLQIFRPISVMLASPAETPADLVANFPNGALVEDKFDGIRAPAHKRDSQVEIYSRTLDRVCGLEIGRAHV